MSLEDSDLKKKKISLDTFRPKVAQNKRKMTKENSQKIQPT